MCICTDSGALATGRAFVDEIRQSMYIRAAMLCVYCNIRVRLASFCDMVIWCGLGNRGYRSRFFFCVAVKESVS